MIGVKLLFHSASFPKNAGLTLPVWFNYDIRMIYSGQVCFNRQDQRYSTFKKSICSDDPYNNIVDDNR